jgi:hypothetical protein
MCKYTVTTILRKSGLHSARSLRGTNPEILRAILWRVYNADRNAPNQGVRVATLSFKLVRTRIAIGWLFLFNAGIPQKILQFLPLLGSGVPPPEYKANHDVGGCSFYVMANAHIYLECITSGLCVR